MRFSKVLYYIYVFVFYVFVCCLGGVKECVEAILDDDHTNRVTVAAVEVYHFTPDFSKEIILHVKSVIKNIFILHLKSVTKLFYNGNQ